MGNQIWVVLLCVVALFIAISYFVVPISDAGRGQSSVGWVGEIIFEVMFGLFGWAAILVPFLMFNHALFHKRDVDSGAIRYKWAFSLGAILCVGMAVAVSDEVIISDTASFSESIRTLFDRGYGASGRVMGGGVLGGGLAILMKKLVGKAGTVIFSVLFAFIFGMFIFGLTPAVFWEKIKFYTVHGLERREARRTSSAAPDGNREKREKDSAKPSDTSEKRPAKTEKKSGAKHGSIDPDVFYGSDDLFDGGSPDTTDKTAMTEIVPAIVKPETDGDDEYGLASIFDEPVDKRAEEKFSAPADDELLLDAPEASAHTEIRVSKKPVVTKHTEEKPVIVTPPSPIKEEPKAPAYIFPPIDLLPLGKKTDEGGVENELRANSQKIVETLASFNIHVRVVNVSRGPAVTRYEVAPEPGTKVSAISNRVEDISLGLASAGVIVEGVIPGKSAIGIEVPNRNVSFVYLRELIDTNEFREAKSRINAALGIDLTGTKIFADIAKMPHLLIAGATGMGKSVCMNSIIVSLLYKATPDEVKFIFIDPKKVELNIYNGLPHLIVPVVFDPKKAAGALHWCVVEMERRYDILEQMGKRNLAQYNEATKDDPAAERLPQIVIVIDELADLMTTAPDDVETSIARIAAKARAAGMHLIIGTQRPDVSVITGTIKSNIPSRIAFTVSSQIDSRTILDGAGAEKLVGRGDMLYSPVGSRLPLRVQGAFVDEKEIEDIVKFIKSNCGTCHYDESISAKIEKEAELCGKKGKGGGGATQMTFDDGDGGEQADDPMLQSAIEIAIDEKKISTSLLQRRLSLGYGRAAKLIDVMEQRGIVSAPDGQKPRSVLITREQYHEMQMRADDNITTDEGEED